MQRRFPQPARVGDLIGLPVLDDDDRTIGHIKHVVRTQAGKLQLIVTYGGFLGWRQRLVAVPIEVVAIAGRQLACSRHDQGRVRRSASLERKFDDAGRIGRCHSHGLVQALT